MLRILIIIFSICFGFDSAAQSMGLDTVFYENYKINKGISVFDQSGIKKELKSIQKQLKNDLNTDKNYYRLAVLAQFSSSGKINKRHGSSISLINEACKLNERTPEYWVVAAFIYSQTETHYHDQNSNTCQAILTASELDMDELIKESYAYQYLFKRCFPKVVMDCPNLGSSEIKIKREVDIISGSYNAYSGYKMTRITSKMVMIDDSFYPADKIDQFAEFVDSTTLNSNIEFLPDHILKLDQKKVYSQLMSLDISTINKLSEASRQIECGYWVQTIEVKEGDEIFEFKFYIPTKKGFIGKECENFLLQLGDIFK
jgi:hypothetical protein